MSFDDNMKSRLHSQARFKSIKGGDELAIMDIPPPEWMIPDLLPVGLTILGGPKNLEKVF